MDNFIEIENLTLKDAVEIAQLENEIFSHPWSKKSFEETLEKQENLCLVARDNKTKSIAGYCIFTISFEDADLCRIAVADKYRRKNIADKMMESAIEKLKKRNVFRILLEVRKNNIPAISLYEKYGFKQLGTRKGYYSEPVEDGLVFELKC